MQKSPCLLDMGELSFCKELVTTYPHNLDGPAQPVCPHCHDNHLEIFNHILRCNNPHPTCHLFLNQPSRIHPVVLQRLQDALFLLPTATNSALGQSTTPAAAQLPILTALLFAANFMRPPEKWIFGKTKMHDTQLMAQTWRYR